MKKAGNRFLLAFLILALSFFGLKITFSDKAVKNRFFSQMIELPDTVLKVEAGSVSMTSLPTSKLRMVYYYGADECMQCCVYHAYELSCMFTQNEYVTIPLFAPNQDDVADVISNIRQYRYEFPVYVIFDDQKEFMRFIPDDVKYHNFLLGRDNVPLFVGDPVHSAEDAEKFEAVVQSYRE